MCLERSCGQGGINLPLSGMERKGTGSLLLSLRLARGLSLKEACNLIQNETGVGISKTHLHRIESGFLPGPKRRAAIAQAFGVADSAFLFPVVHAQKDSGPHPRQLEVQEGDAEPK